MTSRIWNGCFRRLLTCLELSKWIESRTTVWIKKTGSRQTRSLGRRRFNKERALMENEWNDQITFTTFPAFRHLVQTFMFFTEPWYCPFIFLRFGFHRRLVLLFAWLTLFPKRGPLSPTSHRWAIHLLLRYKIDCFTKVSMLAYRRNWGKWFWIKYVNHKTDHHWRDNQLLP